MKKVIVAIVPPTANCGSCKLIGSKSYLETAKQNILWQYNKCLEHDGLQRVMRMPKGTKYKTAHAFGL
jgi:hypothetical protein